MSAAEALKVARAAGVELSLDGDDLVLEAPAPPPEAVLDLLAHNKLGLVALLRPGRDGWSHDDWRQTYEERLAVAMIDGEQPEPEARRVAWESCIVRWWDLHPVRSAPDHCAECGRTGLPGNIVPFGAEPAGHAWLHPGCWSSWFAGRREQAAAALASMGIDHRG